MSPRAVSSAKFFVLVIGQIRAAHHAKGQLTQSARHFAHDPPVG